MRTLPLVTLITALAFPGAARATHFLITGVIDESSPVQANLADCEAGLRELTFVWTIVPTLPGRTDVNIEIRTTTASGSGCTFESGTDNCKVRLASTAWDGSTRVERTYTLVSFFEEEGCVGAGTRKAVLFLKDNQPLIVGGTVEEANRGEIEYEYDFDPPLPPSFPSAQPADNGLRISWEEAGEGSDVAKYRVFWSLDPNTLVGVPDCTGDYRTSCAFGPTVTANNYRIGTLVNGETVYAAVAAIDDFDNISNVSEVVEGTPREEEDFFEHYTRVGGGERGGFCFIATASYGSAWHPLVKSLRRFRDEILLKTEVGRDLVSFYYSWSPALAEVIDDTPFLKGFFQVVLAPVAVSVWFLMETAWWQKILILLGLWGLWWLLGRWRHGRKAAVAAAVLLCFAAGPASADSPRNFFLELKVGAIHPGLDSRPPPVGSARPYESIFGSGSKLAAGFELEYLAYKKYGSLGISVGALFFQSVGKALTLDGLPGTDTTVLNVLPLQVNAVYRWDVAMRRYRVPLVPYAKFGVDWYLWWVLDGRGNVSEAVDGEGSSRRGAGGTWGLHLSLGLQFQLDVVDRRMQQAFDQEVGVNHSYLFAEVVFSRVDDFNDRSFNFSSIYFLAGLALEF